MKSQFVARAGAAQQHKTTSNSPSVASARVSSLLMSLASSFGHNVKRPLRKQSEAITVCTNSKTQHYSTRGNMANKNRATTATPKHVRVYYELDLFFRCAIRQGKCLCRRKDSGWCCSSGPSGCISPDRPTKTGSAPKAPGRGAPCARFRGQESNLFTCY